MNWKKSEATLPLATCCVHQLLSLPRFCGVSEETGRILHETGRGQSHVRTTVATDGAEA